MEDQTIIHIDDLTAKCGHFCGNTCVNNGYGCTHPENEEFEISKIGVEDKRYADDDRILLLIFNLEMRAKYGNLNKFKSAIESSKEDLTYALEIKNRLAYCDKQLLAKYGFKIMHKCYSFSCPIAVRADYEDMKQFDSYLASGYENDPDSAVDADYMIVAKSVIES